MRLRPVLGSETEHEDRALPLPDRDDGRLVGDRLLTEQPAALQDVAVDVRRDPLHVRAPRPGHGLVDLATGQEGGQRAPGHAEAVGVSVLDLDVQRRARTPELVAPHAVHGVAHGNVELVQNEIARLGKGHERPAVANERP